MTKTQMIPATHLRDGDVYFESGYQFRAENVRHEQSYGEGKIRSEWVAVWTGIGDDPTPGWHRFNSAGNDLRTIALAIPSA